MPLSIKNRKAERLIEEVAKATGESKTQAVIIALEERLERLKGRRTVPDSYQAVMEIARRCAALPDEDTRTADQILGYNQAGVFEEE
jgi:antitoxin VapB